MRPGIAETAYLTAVAHRRAGHVEEFVLRLATLRPAAGPNAISTARCSS